MNDESTAHDTTDAAPPPPESPTGPRRLRRSNHDRIIAGVSGGVADYFGIDPIIVRLGFVALALLGGSGIGLYLIAWLVMPDAHENESAAINALRGGHRPDGRAIFAVALLFLGVVVFSGSFFWFPIGDGLFLPLLILAAGIALLVWPSDRSPWSSRWRDEHDARRDEWRQERDERRQSRREWRHGYQRGFDQPAAGDTGGLGPMPPPPPRPAHRRRPRPAPFLGPIGLAVLLLVTGLTVFADRVGWWATDPAAFLAVCLMIIGGVLVTTAFVGRARGLIVLGLLLLPIAWALAAIDLTWWDGVGEELVTVADLEELDDEYRWGMGQFHLNLADLDLDGETREVGVGLTIGELKIWVPDSFRADIEIDGQLGSAIVSDHDLRFNDDGYDIAMARTTGDPTGGTLLLDVDIGIGEAEVIVCGSGSVPCP